VRKTGSNGLCKEDLFAGNSTFKDATVVVDADDSQRKLSFRFYGHMIDGIIKQRHLVNKFCGIYVLGWVLLSDTVLLDRPRP